MWSYEQQTGPPEPGAPAGMVHSETAHALSQRLCSLQHIDNVTSVGMSRDSTRMHRNTGKYGVGVANNLIERKKE